MHINNDFKSKNFDERKNKIDLIIIHSTHATFKDSINILCSEERAVSSHYIIDLKGNIYQLVPDEKKAWHAGKSHWKGRSNINDYSIGIEMVDTSDHGVRVLDFPDKQIEALIHLCKNLISKYKIPPQNILAHSDIAPDRKDDPGQYFDWKKLHSEGIGIFHDIKYETIPNIPIIAYGNETDKVKQIQTLLKEFGYNIKIDGKFQNETCNVILAFKRHFNPNYLEYLFSELDLAILKNLLKKQ